MINDIVNRWPQLFFAQLWQVTLLILFIGIIAKVFLRCRPHVAHLLWCVVLVKLLTPPLLSSSISPFSWGENALSQYSQSRSEFSPWRSDVVRRGNPSESGVVAKRARGNLPETLSGNDAPIAQSHNNTVLAGAAIDNKIQGTSEAREASHGIDHRPTSETAAAIERLSANPFVSGLAIVWFAGVLSYALIAGIMFEGCRRIVSRSRPENAEPYLPLFRELIAQLSVSTNVRLVVSEERFGPVTFGLFRPVVVMPASLLKLQSLGHCKLLLAHELIHVRRRDSWIGLLQALAQSIWWFHPLVWWANRQFVYERERACDEEVVAGLACEPDLYANALLNVLEFKTTNFAPAALPGIRSFEVTKKRLEHIMLRSAHFQKCLPRWSFVVAAIALMLSLPGAAFTTTAEPKVDAKKVLNSEEKNASKAIQSVESTDAGKSREEKVKPTAETDPKLDAQAQEELKRQQSIEVTDVDMVYKDGYMRFKIQVKGPVGTQVFAEFQNVSKSKKYLLAPTTDVLELQNDKPATFELTFSVHESGKLLSNLDLKETKLEHMRIDSKAQNAKHVDHTTLSIPPLYTVEPSERVFKVLKNATDKYAFTPRGHRRVFLVVPKADEDEVPETTPLFAHLYVGVYGQSSKPKVQSNVERDALANRWYRQRTEVGSAHIEYTTVLNGYTSNEEPITPDAYHKALMAANFKDQKDVVSLVRRVYPKIADAIDWKSSKYDAIGHMIRNESFEGSIRINDGEYEMDHRKNVRGNKYDQIETAKVVEGGLRIHVKGLHDFRVSTYGIDVASFNESGIEILPDQMIRLSASKGESKYEVLANYETGFVTYVRYERKQGNDIIRKDKYQFEPIECPGRIFFPKYHFEIEYINNDMKMYELNVIHNIKVNEGAFKELFVMPVKAETYVGLPNNSAVDDGDGFTVREAVPDLAKVLREREARQKQHPAQGTRSGKLNEKKARKD